MLVDFYTHIHKALRRKLFHVSIQTGKTDFTNNDSFMALQYEVNTLFKGLRSHTEHEEKIVHPLLQKLPQTSVEALDVEHHTEELLLNKLEANFGAIVKSQDRIEEGLKFYQGLNHFIARYLHHLHEEEQVHLPALLKHHSKDKSVEIFDTFLTSINSEKALHTLNDLLPALNLQELNVMFQEMRKFLSPEFFKVACQLAEQHLAINEWNVLKKFLNNLKV